MSRRIPAPFFATILTSVALGACLHAADPAPHPTEPRPPVDESTTSTDPRPSADDGSVAVDRVQVGAEDPGRAHREPTEQAALSDGDVESEPSMTIIRGAGTLGTKDSEKLGAGGLGYAGVRHETVTGAAPMAGGGIAPTSRPAPSPARTRAPVGYGTGPVSIAPPPPPRPPVLPQATTDSFTDYGVNGFVSTTDDPLSTFSVDVDTASYTITRRRLREGHLPPQAAVRVEEFVNYFPYEYAPPAKGEPFGVTFEAAPSPWNAKNTIVRVGVQGKRIGVEDRKPLNLTFLVDVSGSMRGPDRIDLVKRSVRMLTETLEDGDTIAIATYASGSEIVLEPTPISNKKAILAAVERLSASGSTAMGAGIGLAYQLADATYAPGSANRVIVCSDGDANVGRVSHTELSAQIKQYAKKGITLTTLGFGNGNFKDTMMERLANDGDGNYFYIDSEVEARRVLVDKMIGTMEVIAKDVKLQVEWDPSKVLAYRLIGYENRDIADKDFRNDAVDAGEIGAGHQVTALYEVALADAPTGALATVRVRNKAPGPEAPAVERAYPMDAGVLRDRFAEGTDAFRIAFAAASFAEILRGSPHLAEVSLRDVEALARSAKRAEYREDVELIELIDRAATLRGEGAMTRR